LRFFYYAMIMTLGEDYSYQHRQCFDRDFQILTSSIRNYIEEVQLEPDAAPPAINVPSGVSREPERTISRLFISHAAEDKSIVAELIELLETIGLTHEQIFCSSFPGYGIELGRNFLDAIKDELLNAETLVTFVLSHRFYASPMCLCEMGATWALTKKHIPILIPPFDFADVKGAIPLTEGFRINDALKLNLFKSKIEESFKLTSRLDYTAWERKRDRILERINDKSPSPGGA
jgi:hypothetical protein